MTRTELLASMLWTPPRWTPSSTWLPPSPSSQRQAIEQHLRAPAAAHRQRVDAADLDAAALDAQGTGRTAPSYGCAPAGVIEQRRRRPALAPRALPANRAAAR